MPMTCHGIRFVAYTALLAAILLSSGPARAGNDESILIGGQAALTGGAVQATVSDGSAAYYNPAGLAHLKGDTFDINASVYGFSVTSVDGLLVLPDDTSLDSTVVDWVLIPSALSYVREFGGGVTASFSIFVPQRSDFVLRTSAIDQAGDQWALTLQEVSNETNYVVGVAFEPSPGVRVGFAGTGLYESSYTALQLGGGLTQAGSSTSFNASEISSTADYGLQLSAGVQWDVSDRITLGATIVSPTLRGLTKPLSTSLLSTNGPDPTQDSFDFDDSGGLDAKWDFITPLELRLGMAVTFAHGYVSLDGDLDTPVKNGDSYYDRRWMGNVRLGGMYEVSDALALGGGVFTDLSPEVEFQTNFLGTSFGLRYTSRYELKDGRFITFSTVLGGRYAFGWGEAEGTRIGSDGAGNLVVGAHDGRLRTHELAANLGSSVNF